MKPLAISILLVWILARTTSIRTAITDVSNRSVQTKQPANLFNTSVGIEKQLTMSRLRNNPKNTAVLDPDWPGTVCSLVSCQSLDWKERNSCIKQSTFQGFQVSERGFWHSQNQQNSKEHLATSFIVIFCYVPTTFFYVGDWGEQPGCSTVSSSCAFVGDSLPNQWSSCLAEIISINDCSTCTELGTCPT